MENKILYTDSNFYSLLAERIRAARKLKGLDQESFADGIGLSRTSLVNIEKGRQRPSIHQLWLMAQILGISIMELLPENAVNTNETNDLEMFWKFELDSSNHQINQDDKSRLLDFISVTRSIK